MLVSGKVAYKYDIRDYERSGRESLLKIVTVRIKAAGSAHTLDPAQLYKV